MPLNPNGTFPQLFGDYHVEALIGRGGQGVVYKARDTNLNRWVALKVPHPHLATFPEVRAAFMQEARIGAQFDHPNLCRIYECKVCENTLYLALQFVEGATLAEFTKIPWIVPGPKEAVEIVLQLARALAAYHDGGLLHRDLKPGNVRVTPAPERKPVLIDFGLALRINARDEHLPDSGEVAGTPLYMPPEQIRPGRVPISVASDVYALGAILYELLTGQPPFDATDIVELTIQVLNKAPVPPSQRRRQVSPELDAICLKALAKNVRDRFVNMADFADHLQRVRLEAGATAEPDAPHLLRPLLPRSAIRFAFADLGAVAPPSAGQQNRLYLDVGNDLRPGVIDHHHIIGSSGSTARLIANRLDLVDASVAAGGAKAFTIVLHREPDLDCLVSAYLAVQYLTTGTLPPEVEPLIGYVDRVDDGESFVSQAQPFTLYAAQKRLLVRPSTSSDTERWNVAVTECLTLLDYVMERLRDGEPLEELDAFASPGLFNAADRATVTDDLQRYRAKLADPGTAARVARLRLPSQFGKEVEVDALLVRSVQNSSDPACVRFFKDWARTDTQRSPGKNGFVALSVFHAKEPDKPQRCILSVTPESEASLRGLGAQLDAAETAKRERVHGVDNRKEDPVTGARLPSRPGYDNADPWYDGRSHAYTIVDAPRGGTLLSAEEIEQIFLDYGAGQAQPLT